MQSTATKRQTFENKPVRQERKPASPEKVNRQRVVRAILSGRFNPSTGEISEPTPEIKPPRKTDRVDGMTFQQASALGKAAKRIFDGGGIDLKYMGRKFLQLYSQGWTEFNGIKCDALEFCGIWEWWSGVDAGIRAQFIMDSCDSGLWNGGAQR